MKLLGIIFFSIGVALCITGGAFLLIDSEEERSLKSSIEYHESRMGLLRIASDSSLIIEFERRNKNKKKAELKSIQSNDKWWLISGGVFIFIGGVFWTISRELTLSRISKVVQAEP